VPRLIVRIFAGRISLLRLRLEEVLGQGAVTMSFFSCPLVGGCMLLCVSYYVTNQCPVALLVHRQRLYLSADEHGLDVRDARQGIYARPSVL